MKRIKRFSLLVSIFVISFALNSAADDLSYVSVSFCTGEVENTLSLQVDADVGTGICYNIVNNSKNDVNLRIGFVDGGFTNDEWKNRACFLDTQIEQFGKFITGYDEIISLKPGESLQQNAMIKYPIGSDGIYHGCIVYALLQEPRTIEEQGGNVAILMRKGKFIDVAVGDLESLLNKQMVMLEDFTAEDGENLSNNPKIRIYKDITDDKYVVALKIKNISLVDQDVVITGVVSNFFIYKNVFVIGRILNKSSSLVVTQKLDNNPNYNLKLKIDLGYEAKVFGDKSVKGSITEKTGFFIFNMITIITLVMLIVVIGVVILLVKDIELHTLKSKKRK